MRREQAYLPVAGHDDPLVEASSTIVLSRARGRVSYAVVLGHGTSGILRDCLARGRCEAVAHREAH